LSARAAEFKLHRGKVGELLAHDDAEGAQKGLSSQQRLQRAREAFVGLEDCHVDALAHDTCPDKHQYLRGILA
jgi:hypothetical protein